MGGIENFSNYFSVKRTSDSMSASLHLKKDYHLELSFSKDDLKEELASSKLQSGWVEEALEEVVNGAEMDQFPIEIARGTPPVHGENGKVVYEKELSKTFSYDEKENVNFRDVIQIPSVHAGDKLLTIIDPGDGTPGMNVLGQIVPAKPGKAVTLRPGQNIEWNKRESAMYATVSGQISVGSRSVSVYPLYEVKEDVSMRTGNIDFVGSVVIRGNVPTGYEIKSSGDITIYGLVEGASIVAEGSVYISEGIAAHGKGRVEAGVDVKCGYINQGIVEAGRDVFVENSVLHSEVVAREHIYCQKGNIIGGSLSAGASIEARDIGNKMSTSTQVYLGSNKKIVETEKVLQAEKEELTDTLRKLNLIGDKLIQKQKQAGLTSKERVTLLRQRNSLEQTNNRLQVVETELADLVPDYEDGDQAYLAANGTLHAHVTIAFGKYHRREARSFTKAKAIFKDGDVLIRSLDE